MLQTYLPYLRPVSHRNKKQSFKAAQLFLSLNGKTVKLTSMFSCQQSRSYHPPPSPPAQLHSSLPAARQEPPRLPQKTLAFVPAPQP